MIAIQLKMRVVLRQNSMRTENSAIPCHDGCLIQVIPSPSNAKNLPPGNPSGIPVYIRMEEPGRLHDTASIRVTFLWHRNRSSVGMQQSVQGPFGSQPNALPKLCNLLRTKILAPRGGFEPPTFRLTATPRRISKLRWTVSVNFSPLFPFCSQVLINFPPLPLHFRDSQPFGKKPLELFTNDLPEREFSEENQQVAMKRERQLLFFIHLLFASSHQFSTATVTFSWQPSCSTSVNECSSASGYSVRRCPSATWCGQSSAWGAQPRQGISLQRLERFIATATGVGGGLNSVHERVNEIGGW